MSAKWGHAETDHPDRWSGSFDTREDAIAEGRQMYEGAFFIQSGSSPSATSYVPTAKDVLEDMGNRACDEAREAASEWPDVSEEGMADLDTFLRSWALKHCPVTFWIAIGAPERIEVA